MGINGEGQDASPVGQYISWMTFGEYVLEPLDHTPIEQERPEPIAKLWLQERHVVAHWRPTEVTAERTAPTVSTAFVMTNRPE